MRKLIKTILIATSFAIALPTFTFANDDVTLDVANLKQAVPNIYTGGQPSLNDIKSMKDKGFTLIVNVRGKVEYAEWDKFTDFDEEQEVEKAGITYVSIPFKGMAGLTKENAAKFHAALEANKSKGGKVLLHCLIGMRAGGLLGLHEYFYNGKSKEEAIQIAVDAHMEHNREYVTNGYKGIRK